ncbi:MAG TPA: GNAT family N-acetyltransferase [Dehalococcoidia bacterium]|nr:GNAT family N-acetyltransferase [Dehalococcoidia bacterium]
MKPQPRPLLSASAKEVVVRPAVIEDLPRLTEIYNHYVVNTATTFDLDPFTVDERRAWFAHYAPSGRHRLIVAERDGYIAGYASSSPFHPRRAYETTVEMTVLCAPEAVGYGIGRRLYEALLPALRGEDVHRAAALITLPNRGSCALHERFGFRHAMTITEAGRKFGRYWDVAWYVRDMPSGATGLREEGAS